MKYSIAAREIPYGLLLAVYCMQKLICNVPIDAVDRLSLRSGVE
jgi:hypothetical protein